MEHESFPLKIQGGAGITVLLSPGAPGTAWTQQPAMAASMPLSH